MKTIAVDIDDVLALSIGDFLNFSNKQWGTELKITDYDENLPKMWQISLAETSQRIDELFASGLQVEYKPVPGSGEVLKGLSKKYKLVAATSRPKQIRQDTTDWIDVHFKDVFTEVSFAGMWDEVTSKTATATKQQLCRQIGADYLIDDQPKHCLALVGADIQPILFGDYPWNQLGNLPKSIEVAKDWRAVEEYFETQ